MSDKEGWRKNPDEFDPSMRRPVLEAVWLPDGNPSNKYTMLMAAINEGSLQVARILTTEEAEEVVSAGGRVFHRGYMVYDGGADDAGVNIDPFAVDVLLSEEMVLKTHVWTAQSRLIDDAETHRVDDYLRKNFGIERPVEIKGFFQERIEIGRFVTSWKREEWLFVNTRNSSGDRGITTLAYYDGQLVDEEMMTNDELAAHELLEDMGLFDDLQEAEGVYERLVGDKCMFKFDWLLNWEGNFLLQARIAGRKESAEEIVRQERMIEEMKKMGVETVHVEVMNIGRFNEMVPSNRPYILSLTHKEGGRAIPRPQCLKIDMRWMVGLVLPPCLRHGLLEHSGYRFLAYAIYYGLPVAIG